MLVDVDVSASGAAAVARQQVQHVETAVREQSQARVEQGLQGSHAAGHGAVQTVADFSRTKRAAAVVVIAPPVDIGAEAAVAVEIRNDVIADVAVGIRTKPGRGNVEVEENTDEQVQVSFASRILFMARHVPPCYPAGLDGGRPA